MNPERIHSLDKYHKWAGYRKYPNLLLAGKFRNRKIKSSYGMVYKLLAEIEENLYICDGKNDCYTSYVSD